MRVGMLVAAWAAFAVPLWTGPAAASQPFTPAQAAGAEPPADGIEGLLTALGTANPPAPDDPATIQALQQALASAGYSPGPADGRWGPATQAAVTALLWDRCDDLGSTDIFHCDRLLAVGGLTPEEEARAYKGAAVVRGNLGQFDEAIALNTEAIARDPAYVAAYHNRGWAYLHRGDYAEAIRDFDIALRLDPDLVEAYVNRGFAHRYLRHWDQAIADSSRALALDPGQIAARRNRAEAYLEIGADLKAIVDFDTILAARKDDAGTYFSRGYAYANLGDQAHAVADYDRALAYGPEDPVRVHYQRAWSLVELGELARALPDYDQVVAAYPDDTDALFDRAWVLGQLGEWQRAADDYGRVIALDPNNADALVERGHALLALDQPERAVMDFHQALAIGGSTAVLLNEVAWGEFLAGDTADALAHVTAALRLAPDDFATLDTYAHVLAATGQPDQAVEQFRTIGALYGAEAVADYEAALAAGGFDPGPQDGVFDAATARALRACFAAPPCVLSD